MKAFILVAGFLTALLAGFLAADVSLLTTGADTGESAFGADLAVLAGRAEVDFAGVGVAAGALALRLARVSGWVTGGAAADVAVLRPRRVTGADAGWAAPLTRASVFSVFVALCAGMAFFGAFRTEPVRSAIAIPQIQNGRTAGRRALRGWQEYGTCGPATNMPHLGVPIRASVPSSGPDPP